MGDKEDHETMLQEMEAHQLAEKTAWLRVFIHEASKRGHNREDIIALLDEPGITVQASRAADSVYQEAKSSVKSKLGRQEGIGVLDGPRRG